MPACDKMVSMSLWSHSGVGETRELEPCLAISHNASSNHSTLVGLCTEGRTWEEEERIGGGEWRCGLCSEQVGKYEATDFSSVCFLLLLLLACFLLILVWSWFLGASRAISCPTLTYTFCIVLPTSHFKLLRKRAQWAQLVFLPVSTPEAGIWLLWCWVWSPGRGWNGRATCWRTDSCSAEAVVRHLLWRWAGGLPHGRRTLYTSVTDCVPCKICDQRAHRQTIVAHGHERVLVFHTFGSKEKGFHVKLCMQQEATTPTTNKRAWRVIFIRKHVSVQFNYSVISNSLQPHGMQDARPPCPSPTPGVTQTHVHWVSDAIQPSHPLSSPSPPVFSLSQHQDLFQWVSSSHQVAKGLEFQFQYQSFQWILRIDLL